jgi:diaminopimelate epimerase
MRYLTLSKHHGLGNDFLVWLADETPTLDVEALAVALCDRRRGFGADGLLLGTELHSERPHMALFNADGSRAEMSGNGIRCFAHSLARARRSMASLLIVTDAGERMVEFVDGELESTVRCTVDMGLVETIAEPRSWSELGVDPMRPVRHLSLGNPHSVVAVDEVGVVDLASLGSVVPHVNLEIVEPGPEPGAVTMRVHERGAGITQACGTGACASAWAASEWGLVPSAAREIVVHMDGGDATVKLNHPSPGRVTLVGTSTYVGDVSRPVSE